jgi:hypothetical protein
MLRIKPFLLGVLCTMMIFAGGYKLWEYYLPNTAAPITIDTIPPGTVLIDALPTYRTLNGINVSFKGKESFEQPIAGRAAKDIIIVSFKAMGENAGKSTINILWEDGTVERIPAGTMNRRLPSERVAKQITIQGYCVHERKIFRDSSRTGTLNWEIHYQAVES